MRAGNDHSFWNVVLKQLNWRKRHGAVEEDKARSSLRLEQANVFPGSVVLLTPLFILILISRCCVTSVYREHTLAYTLKRGFIAEFHRLRVFSESHVSVKDLLKAGG